MSLQELMDGLTLLTSGSEFEKLCFLFQVYDVDGMMLLVLLYGCHHCYFSSTKSCDYQFLGNGYIDYEELKTVLKFCMTECALHFSDDILNDLTRALFEEADTDNSGTITFEELKAELDKHPGKFI